MPPVTRHQSAHLLRSLPEDLLSRVLEFACEGQPWSKKCHLAEVCKAFKALVDAQAFRDAPLVLKMSEIAGCLEAPRQRERLDLRCSLMRALGRIAPSVTRIRVLCDLYGGEGVDVEAVLCMAGGAAREVEVALGSYRGVQGLLQELEDKFAYPELQKIALHDCSFWADWDHPYDHELFKYLPRVASMVQHLELAAGEMPPGGGALLQHLTALRSLVLDDWDGAALAEDWAPLRGMPHLTSLVLSSVEALQDDMPHLLALTQVRELSLLSCYSSSPALSQLTSLISLDLQGNFEEEEEEEEAPAAAWRCSSLRELRWCGSLRLGDGPAPVQLPHLLSLEIDDAIMPAEGFPAQLCTALSQLTALRLTGGVCPALPPEISCMQALASLSMDSLALPRIPKEISCLTSLTNLLLSSTPVGPYLPPWLLSLPVQHLWLAGNELRGLLHRSRGMPAEQRTAWLGRLTHLNCSLNPGIKAVPAQLEHATALRELDLSYCNKLQISMEAADMLAELTSLSMLRLGKSYWLKQTDRWTPASMKAIRRLQKARPDLSIDYQHPGGNAAAW